MATRVVNLRVNEFDIYIGRASPRKSLIGSVFHNPFALNTYAIKSPAEQRFYSLLAFAQYFYTKLNEEPEFLRQVLALRGKTLGCWCKPLACHGDVIAHFVDVVSEGVEI